MRARGKEGSEGKEGGERERLAEAFFKGRWKEAGVEKEGGREG